MSKNERDHDPKVADRIQSVAHFAPAEGLQYDLTEMFDMAEESRKAKAAHDEARTEFFPDVKGTVKGYAEIYPDSSPMEENPYYLPSKDPVHFKYGEDMYLAEVAKYLESTYRAHYVGTDGIQSFDAIKASGHGVGFTVGDIIKYAMRFGKKDGYNRKDVLKIIHYAILLLHVMDAEELK